NGCTAGRGYREYNSGEPAGPEPIECTVYEPCQLLPADRPSRSLKKHRFIAYCSINYLTMASTASFQRKVQVMTCSIIFTLLSAACQHGHPGVYDLQVGPEGKGEAFVGQELPVTAHLSVHAPIVRADVEIRAVSDEGWTFQQQYTEGLAGKMHARFETGI